MQAALATARLNLLPVTPDDVDMLWRLWTNPDVRQFLWDDRVIAREEALATVNECLEYGQRGIGLWRVEIKEQRRWAGCAGLLPAGVAASFDPRIAGLIEPLVALMPDVWGHGYGREALRALLHHASSALGYSQMAGVTDVPNLASDRMLRSVGFQVLGEVDGPNGALRTYLWQRAG